MLPQSLVQNKLIGTDNGASFAIDWDKASQIVDTNFYYTWRLVDESYYYRAAQYPYTLVEKPSGEERLKLHQYYISQGGEYVYCIQVNPSYQTMSWTPGYYRYTYDELTGYLTLTLSQLPVYIRCAYWGLTKAHRFIISDSARRVSDSEIIIDIINTDFAFAGDDNLSPTKLCLSTDQLMGRILLDNKCIAYVPVSVIKTPNTDNSDYNFSISIPNLNYPQNAILEVY